jgi:4-alpha-glucanotransferase
MWALAVQLYGVRSQRNWGHGDFTDLAHLLELASELGAAGIGLNPLHCLFDDCAETPSPYSPNSRVFLNPLYIDLEAVPEFPGIDAAGLNAEVADLRRRELVDHAGVARLKTKALHLAYQNFRYDKGPRSEAFERFRRERGAVLTRFACFEFLRRAHGKPWWEWPEPQRTPAGAAATMTETADVDVMFFAYVQWLAEQQLQACCERARDLGLPLGLYLDVAVGVRPDGFDAWNEQDAILASLRVGAPPDPFNVAGQNWGLAAFNPFGLEARAFEPFRMMLRASMRYAGAIRIDHVLGLRRVYVIPKGLRADQGAYVRYPIEALLAVIAQESVCHRCIVVGEDLGTVPEGLRETLADWGIWSYQVMMFERARNGAFQPPQSYRANALATFSTHDLPTFAGWASGHDLEAKRALGIDPGETDEERRAAWRYLRNALSACSATDMDFSSVAAFLGDTPSRLVVVAIEDALGIRDQANMPGTIDEHPNWRRRLPVSLHDLRSNPRLEEIAEALRRAGRSTR